MVLGVLVLTADRMLLEQKMIDGLSYQDRQEVSSSLVAKLHGLDR